MLWLYMLCVVAAWMLSGASFWLVWRLLSRSRWTTGRKCPNRSYPVDPSSADPDDGPLLREVDRINSDPAGWGDRDETGRPPDDRGL